MKNLIVVFTIIYFSVVNIYSEKPKSTSPVTDLLDLMETKANLEKMKKHFEKIIRSKAPTVSKKLLSQEMEKFHHQELYDIMIPIFQKHFTDEEILDIIKFYKTKTGRKFILEMPSMLQESMQASSAWSQRQLKQIYHDLKSKGVEVKE